MKASFHTAGVPPALAQSLLASLQQTAATYGGKAFEETEASRFAQGDILKRAFGEQRAIKIIEEANFAARKLGESLFRVFPGAAFSAESLVALSNVAAILKYKSKE